MRRLVILLAALVLAPSVAVAQPGVTPPQNPDDEMPTTGRAPTQPAYHYEPAYTLPPPVMPETKSEGTGVALALGATIAGYAMIGASADRREGGGGLRVAGLMTIMIGPSAGHIYAGETGHAVKMSLLRTAGFVAMVAGIVKATTGSLADCIDCNSQSSSGSRDNATALFLVGGATFVAATVYDIVDSAGAVRRRNSRSYLVAPMYAQTSSGAVPGVALSGRF